MHKLFVCLEYGLLVCAPALNDVGVVGLDEAAIGFFEARLVEILFLHLENLQRPLLAHHRVRRAAFCLELGIDSGEIIIA